MKNMRRLYNKITLTLGLTLIAGGVSWYLLSNNHIKHNLEKDALLCRDRDNLSGIIYYSPSIKNEDLDKDGKYESAIFYKDEEGNMIYQEIRKLEGKLVLDEPKFLKR